MRQYLLTSLLILLIGTAASAESLWNKSQSRQSLFADSKAHEVGDILTIVISENAQAEDALASSTSKSHNLDFGVTSFLNADKKLFGADESGNVRYPRATLDAKNDFQASGDRSRKSTITAQIAATVRAVQRNGNLVIEGRRCIVLDGETKNIIMTGIVRPDDVSADNTIASNAIADAQITYDGFGAITDAAKPGLLTRILGIIPVF